MIDYTNEIIKLKKEKNAVILAHYYQRPEIQDIADFIGDSLYLSKIARDIESEMIVFCGVLFMAESAKLLSPDKKVILPQKFAGCPMANMAKADDLRKYKKENPNTTVICYVNSTAETKALSDVCVTSSNAETIIKEYKDHKLLYLPDQNLGAYLRKKYNLNMDLWPGYCYVHNRISLEEVQDMQQKYPNAELLVHPEMKLEITEIADHVGSTKGLLEYTKTSSTKQFLVGTESGIIHQMNLASPDKEFIEIKNNFVCRNMKLTTLKDLYNALLNEETEIHIPENIIQDAKKSLDKMFEITERNA